MFSRHRIRIAAATVAAAMLGGCASANHEIGQSDPAFGEALAYDKAIQIIDPDPVYPPGGALPGDNGDKAAQSVKRYRTDQVKQVEQQQTTSGSGGSGGGPR